MNWKIIIERLKSPVVLFGIVALIVQAAQIDPSSLTSWDILGANLVAFLGNPIQLATAFYLIFGLLNNPETKDKF